MHDDKKVAAIWIKNPNNIITKIINTKPSMIDMKPQDAIKIDIADLDKFETYPEENVLPLKRTGLCGYLYQHGVHHGDQIRWNSDFIWSENT